MATYVATASSSSGDMSDACAADGKASQTTGPRADRRRPPARRDAHVSRRREHEDSASLNHHGLNLSTGRASPACDANEAKLLRRQRFAGRSSHGRCDGEHADLRLSGAPPSFRGPTTGSQPPARSRALAAPKGSHGPRVSAGRGMAARPRARVATPTVPAAGSRWPLPGCAPLPVARGSRSSSPTRRSRRRTVRVAGTRARRSAAAPVAPAAFAALMSAMSATSASIARFRRSTVRCWIVSTRPRSSSSDHL